MILKSSVLTFNYSALVLIYCIVLNIQNVFCVEKELFSSVTGMETLLQTEQRILFELENYVNNALYELQALQSEIAAIKEEHSAASKGLEDYLTSPVNAYRLIKRLHSDWNAYQESVKNDYYRQTFLENMNSYRQNLTFPAETDIYNSALALIRIQQTYNLDVPQLASGIINDIKYGPAMSWQDCFLLAHQLFEMKAYNQSVPWLKQSMRILEQEDYKDETPTLDFIERVAGYHQEMGDYETALDLVNKILTAEPERTGMEELKAELEQLIRDGVKQGLLHETASNTYDYHQTDDYKAYLKVCRDEMTLTPTQQRPLRCRYFTNGLPYRLLQPFKLEEHYLDPYIIQLHDVISEETQTTIKELATPRLARSKVKTVDGTESQVARFRTSKSAWIQYDEHPYTQLMRLNVEHLSGLDLRYAAEDMQVANYGIGGHYEPHFDYFETPAAYDSWEGNRIATAIYYLADVEKGGGTAFPRLSLSVKPEKGSVLFWYNLHRSLDFDYRTRHGACPVLKGSKWIANIWIRSGDQMSRRPCDLTNDNGLSIALKNLI